MKNIINWFEIPVADFDRARNFYETIFNYMMDEEEFGPFKMGMFPVAEGKVGGAIVFGEGYVPSAQGALVYLNANPDLNTVLNRIEKAGGKVLMGKTHISDEMGYFAFFTDSEGNKVALHSHQ